MITKTRKSVRATVSPASGGTQSNEFEAAIKSVTSSTDVGAVFLYDTSQDSDGGKWRKKTSHTSWAREASSATRSARSEFPAMALIVCDHDGTAGTTTKSLTIYDLDDPAMGLWMQFQTNTNYLFPASGGNYNMARTVYALNGRLYCGVAASSAVNWGFFEIDFTNDSAFALYSSAAYSGPFNGTISERNTAKTSVFTGGAGNLGPYSAGIVSNAVNDVAATVLEGAEIGALGLPIPTVAVATGAGISVIHGGSGAVYDKKTTSAAATLVEFDEGGNLWAGNDDYFSRFDSSTLFATATAAVFSSYENGGTIQAIRQFDGGGKPVLLGTSSNNNDSLAVMGSDFACGSAAGLTRAKFNGGNHEESAVAYINSEYNTGYMVGDIRLAALTKTNLMADRSVKGNTLAEVGNLNAQEVASGAENYALYGFSASNYLTRTDANLGTTLDFDTGDFSIMFWVKLSSQGNDNNVLAKSDASTAAGDWFLRITDANLLRWYRSAGSGWGTATGQGAIKTSTGTISTNWAQVSVVKRSSKLNFYINGQFDSSVADTHDYTSNGDFTVGHCLSESNAAEQASLSLLRISATAPTPQQVKEIYDAEKPLFAAGAKCLLAANQVNDLAYDKTSGLLHVASESTASSKSFRGLEAVESLTSDGSLGLTAATEVDGITAAGGVLAAYDNAKVGVNLPALDVRAELNDGESKIPDDGKLHFEGVTTDATQTVIGNIPVAEDENIIINARVTSKVYKFASYASHYEDVSTSYQREIGGNVAVSSAFSNPTHSISDNNVATMDVVLAANTSNNTVEIKVTGAAYRIEWKASVEVQRISDKLYER